MCPICRGIMYGLEQELLADERAKGQAQSLDKCTCLGISLDCCVWIFVGIALVSLMILLIVHLLKVLIEAILSDEKKKA